MRINKKPTPEGIRLLRKRHKLTQNALADSLYGVKRNRIADWESGRRGCPLPIWWMMVLVHDALDLRDGIKKDLVEREDEEDQSEQ